MKKLKTILLAFCATLAFIPSSYHKAQAQTMPLVYDNTFGKENRFDTACADFQSGDVVTAGKSGNGIVMTWIDRVGAAKFTKKFTPEEFNAISRITALSEDKVLVVGSRSVPARDKNRHSGCARIINIKGDIERSAYVGAEGTVLTSGRLLASGNMILSGSTPNANGGRSAFIAKVSPGNSQIYGFTALVGETCNWFDVLGSRTEYLNAAFSSPESGSSVVRLDENGKPYFITTIPDPSFRIEKMVSTADGDIYVVGQGKQAGGAVIKIRQEGDIVFQKQIAPATAGTKFDKLVVCPTGEILVGGNDHKNAFFALLRSDGTELSSNVDKGIVSGIACNPANSETMVSLFDAQADRGKIIKMSREGRRLYEKMTGANYTALRVNSKGDLTMASPSSGRLGMISNFGELLFDRFVVESVPVKFTDVYLPFNGEAVFTGMDSRVAKLAHGLSVSDIQVSKPISGYSTAIFTVTLSGYSFSSEGAPIPVTVKYNTKPLSASEGVNYDPVSGILSFVPAVDGGDNYLNKFTVEVPVSANDLLEGNRTFALNLSDVTNSYLVKPTSTATIEDQPAIVKMIRSTPGMEGERDVVYELGIFKRNGTPLTNATKSDIVIDGVYGSGTTDKLDFDMGRIPRLVISSGKHSGEFNVVTLDDTRYEAEKMVVVNFNKVYSMSDTDVSFGGNLLSCEGTIYDQPAMVAIESLGNHSKRNNTMSGLFKISLVRAKDGALLTNNSGSEIEIVPAVNAGSTAKEGVDFVLTNAHDLRIFGDGRSSAVNLSGLVLYTPGKDQKTVSVTLQDVKGSGKAGKLSVSPSKKTAQFDITNE